MNPTTPTDGVRDGEDNKLKQQVNQYLFDIKRMVRNKAYWNAAKTSHDLYQLLNAQPYVEANNPDTYPAVIDLATNSPEATTNPSNPPLSAPIEPEKTDE